MKNLLFIGFKKSGKSTIGALIAQKMKFAFLDTDLLVEELYFQKYQIKKSCFEIYKEHQEPFFRALEQEVIFSLQKEKNVVIATGGGSLLLDENVQILKKNGLFIFLDAPMLLLEKRLKKTPSFLDNNPLGLEALFCERRALYLSLADLRIAVEKKSKERLVLEIIGEICGKQ